MENKAILFLIVLGVIIGSGCLGGDTTQTTEGAPLTDSPPEPHLKTDAQITSPPTETQAPAHDDTPKMAEEVHTTEPPVTQAPVKETSLPEVIWQEDQLVQPVPAHGSKIRLSLPVEIDEILLEKDIVFQAFGAHVNDKADGVETATISIKPGTKIRSLADGTIRSVYQGDSYLGCQIAISYGDGLYGHHHNIKECIVEVGQEVKMGDIIGEGNSWGDAPPSIEFLLEDANRKDGPEGEYMEGQAVSMYDYLNKEDQEAFIQLYIEKFIVPYIKKGQSAGNSVTLWEPFLTNKLLIHQSNDGRLVGEWLSTEKWVSGDGKPDVVTFMEADHSLWKGTYMRGHDIFNYEDIISGSWEADYEKGQVLITGEEKTFYGIFEIDETGELAELKFEYQEGSYPAGFSEKVVTFVERKPIGMLNQGTEMGVFDFG